MLLENQLATLPRYIAALGWASSTASNVNFGWQQRDAKPFQYSTWALEKLIEASNVGADIGYFFDNPLRSEIDSTSTLIRRAIDQYQILRNASPPPDSNTQEMREIFSDIVPKLNVVTAHMEKEYRRLVDLPA